MLGLDVRYSKPSFGESSTGELRPPTLPSSCRRRREATGETGWLLTDDGGGHPWTLRGEYAIIIIWKSPTAIYVFFLSTPANI